MLEIEAARKAVEEKENAFVPYGFQPGINQLPPCTNGCGNDEIEPITDENHPVLKDLRRRVPHHSDSRIQIQYFFCKTCLSLFVIKIKLEDWNAENVRLDLAA